MLNHTKTAFNDFSEILNGRLPLKQGSYKAETCTQLVLGYPQHLIFRNRIFVSRIFVGVRNLSDVILIRICRSSTHPPLPPLLRKKQYRNLGKVIRSISGYKSSKSELSSATFGYFPYRRRRFPGGGSGEGGSPANIKFK